MPLLPGAGAIGHNITELEQHGSRPRSHKQIVAIALSEARRTGADIPTQKRYRVRIKNKKA